MICNILEGKQRLALFLVSRILERQQLSCRILFLAVNEILTNEHQGNHLHASMNAVKFKDKRGCQRI